LLYKIKKRCRLCDSIDLVRVINLCNSPLANNLALTKKDSLKSNFFPLNIMLCKKCKHVQLQHVINAKALYSNYLYMTGVSNEFKIHFKNYSKTALKKINKQKDINILEIGSNDCTLLDYFNTKKYNTVGIEPANNLWQKTRKRHKIINGFYNAKTNKILKKNYSSFDLIFANNVFAHIDDLKSVFKLLTSIMHNNSLVIFEVSYLLDLIRKKLFDTIYHEHLDYHSITPLIAFFNKLHLKIIDIQKIPMHGGSIRVFVAKKKSRRIINHKKINKFIKQEDKYKLKHLSTFINFSNKIEEEKNKLSNFFNKIGNYRIYGYGAPAKAVTLINFFNLNQKNINLIIDDSKLKQKKYIPGSKIKIYNSKILKTKPPKYIVILAWNVYKDILNKIKKYDEIEYAIIPLPKFKIIKL